MKIGIIGLGMVGNAVNETFKTVHETIIYDKFKRIGAINDTVNADLIFVCVPTPTLENGEQDLDPLTSVLTDLNELLYNGVVVIKCTVLPGTCSKLSAQFPDLQIVHNPEFLTEKNSVKDFRNQKTILLSSPNYAALTVASTAYIDIFSGEAPCKLHNKYESTEMAKYIHNCFLATKVAFFNEIYNLCKTLNIDYSIAKSSAASQMVIGESHTQVPGPDGKFGFGGACFPKDTAALLKNNEETLGILKAAVESNKKQRLR